MTFDFINDDMYKHLVCIIIGGAENDGVLHGLAHVCEHMCLLPFIRENNEDPSYSTYGYTCIDHMVLSFSSQKEDSLKKIIEMIKDKSIVRVDRVEIAKHQVICECNNLKKEIALNEKIVGFVTDNRITNFAAGKVDDIKRITTNDVQQWIDGTLSERRMFSFELDDINYDFLETINDIKRKHDRKEPIYKNVSDQYLYLNKILERTCNVDIYFPLAHIRQKQNYIHLIIGERYIRDCLRKWVDNFNGDIDVSEKYFSFQERYLLISLGKVRIEAIDSLVSRLHSLPDDELCTGYYLSQKTLFEEINELEQRIDNKRSERLIALINKVVYGIPEIKKDDLVLFESTEKGLCKELKESLSMGAKIVVR